MLSRRLCHALPSRRARVALAAIAYLVFAVTVIATTLHRDDEDTLKQQAESAQSEGRSASWALDFKTAERRFRASIDLIRACGLKGNVANAEWYAEAHQDLADALSAQGRLADAEAAYRQALRLYERADGRDSENCIDPLSSLADLYAAAGRDSAADACAARIDEIYAAGAKTAETEFANFRAAQRATAKHHPVNSLETANRLMDLGRLHIERGDAARAEIEFAEAYNLRLAALGPYEERTVAARDHLGQARAVIGKFAQARADLESSLANNQRAFGRDGLYFLHELTLLGNIAMRCADYAAADSCYLRVVENVEQRVGREHWYLVPALEKLAACRTEMGQFAVARGLRERIMSIHKRALGAESYAVGVDLLKLAEIDDRAGASGLARAHCSAALRTLKAAVGPRHPMTVEAGIYLSELWDAASRPVDPEAVRSPRRIPAIGEREDREEFDLEAVSVIDSRERMG
ncbi:MAG TPA: tetratricopeptide repeat protein [Candidatus Eisenbacteria bacterium]|nr:tetratricopeptide repeat protein [Candidatus Eisenbacteria bacterium]